MTNRDEEDASNIGFDLMPHIRAPRVKPPLGHMNERSNAMTELGWQDGSRIRFHGERGSPVITLHGGPGAYGGAARLAQGLSGDFRVIEPWQRPSGGIPLSVAVHVEDLYNLILSRLGGESPALVGSSWGAMLALAYAAGHSTSISAIVLVGCGTFDKASRDVIVRRRRQKIADYICNHPEHEADLQLDIGEQMMKWHGMTDAYDPLPIDHEPAELEGFDIQGHTETWQDMVRCQETGVYPQSFSSVTVPAIMLHGADDPHPGTMIRDTLKKYIPHLEYHEFARCGHDPEIEKCAKEDFFAVLRGWLTRTFSTMDEAQQSHGGDA